ncbi:hypothetical protein L2V98_19965, partial [Escherichia coli]|nr:hypothetical protein [Escherichia coli]
GVIERLEPYAGKLARTVLRGRLHSNVQLLPDAKTLNNWWNQAKHAAEKKSGVPFGCNFHDIKAKGISDYEGSSRDKQIFSGHKTENQVLIYDRKTKITPTLDLPLVVSK